MLWARGVHGGAHTEADTSVALLFGTSCYQISWNKKSEGLYFTLPVASSGLFLSSFLLSLFLICIVFFLSEEHNIFLQVY